jgi:hypothetical protein
MTISSGYTASGNNNHKRQLKRSWQGRLGMVDVPALRGWREWVFFFFFPYRTSKRDMILLSCF